ncbi:MAG: nuclear transport factor 2 family protein [Bacteroidetes bacterium]|nr:nuclear transport factor 2 family protein [Bacteroidota bacterium]
MTERIDHPVVKAAIDALNAHDKAAWNALLAPGATFSDDGREGSLAHFTEGAFGKGREHFTSVDRVEHGGLHVYGHYRSETWGTFTTFFKFQVDDGRITRLEVGQADH